MSALCDRCTQTNHPNPDYHITVTMETNVYVIIATDLRMYVNTYIPVCKISWYRDHFSQKDSLFELWYAGDSWEFINHTAKPCDVEFTGDPDDLFSLN